MKAASVIGVVSTSAATLLCCTVPAYAQTVAPDPKAPSESAAPPAEQPSADIVVTAQRRSESAQRVPVSLTVVTDDTLRSRHLNDIQQLTLAAPSLQLGAENTFSIRGVGTLSFALTLDSSVATSFDDVNLSRPGLGGNLFNDVVRVEVLNGPQGLLFGKNASAGLLNVVTNRPRIGVLENLASVEYGVHDTITGRSDGVFVRETLNVPVSKTSALRVNLLYNYQNPITRFVGGGGRADDYFRQFGIRAKYLIQPSDNFEIYLIGEYDREKGIAGSFDRTYRQLGAGSQNAGPVAASGYTASPTNLSYAGDGDFFRNFTTGGAQAQFKYTFGGFEITDIAAWKYFRTRLGFDTDFTVLDGASYNRQQADFNQYSNELRLTTPTGSRLEGVAGLYFFRSIVDEAVQLRGSNYIPALVLQGFPFCVNPVVLGAPPAACPYSNVAFLGQDTADRQRTTSYAAFSQATYKLTPGIRLILGGRVTRDELTFSGSQQQLSYFVPIGGPRLTTSDRTSNTNFSWKGGVQVDLAKDIMAYATYARGYKGPGFNMTAVAPGASLVVNPETVQSFEGGIKTTFFNRALIFNLSGFYSKFNNYQSQSFNTNYRSFVVQNAASATVKGFEATVSARPVTGLSLNGSLSYVDSRFNDFAGAQCYIGQPDPACSADADGNGVPDGVFNAGGRRTPNSPKLTVTGQARYERPLSDNVSAFIDGNIYHRSSVNYLVNGAPGATIGPVDILGANVGLALFGDKMRFSLFCKNCTDRRVPNSISLEPGDSANGIATTYLQWFGQNSARTIGFSLDTHF